MVDNINLQQYVLSMIMAYKINYKINFGCYVTSKAITMAILFWTKSDEEI